MVELKILIENVASLFIIFNLFLLLDLCRQLLGNVEHVYCNKTYRKQNVLVKIKHFISKSKISAGIDESSKLEHINYNHRSIQSS